MRASFRIGTTVKGTPVETVSMGRSGSRSPTAKPVVLTHKFGINLRHLAESGGLRRVFETHRDRSHIEIQRDLLCPGAAAEGERGAQSRMARERKLFGHSENADAGSAFALGGGAAGKDEGSFGKVRFPCN